MLSIYISKKGASIIGVPGADPKSLSVGSKIKIFFLVSYFTERERTSMPIF